jgi:hypothetical protein
LEEVEILIEGILKDLGELIEQFGINIENVDKLFAVFGLEFGLNVGGVKVICKDEWALILLKESFEEIYFLLIVFKPGVGFPFLE